MANKSTAEQSLKILSEKSQKSIELFKQTNYQQKTGNEKLNKVIEQYLSRWKDTTRPAMLALAFEAVGSEQGKAVPLQFALLHIDATMDIHDDIIDESVAKKRVKTIYGKIGKETALLIGDKFMVEGFIHLHKALENLPLERQGMIMAGVRDFLSEVVDAHVLEAALKADKWRVKPKKYLQVLAMKAADIEGRMKVGAIYGGGSTEEIEALSTVGRNIGTLLAIRAEYIDLFEADELSNRVNSECLPLPILYAIKNKVLEQKIRKILSSEQVNKKDCADIVDLVLNSKEISPLKNHLGILRKEAVRSLAVLKNSPAKSDLQTIIASMLEDL
jgi:geranylgeranyl diphosphate synthase, type I